MRAELTSLIGTHPVLRRMLDRGLPLNREVYMALNYGPNTPDPWTHEHEGQLPRPFQDPNAVGPPDDE